MGKATAKLGDVIIADSDRTIELEGSHYFPAEDVNMACLSDSQTQTECPWKGMASYKNVEANGQLIEDAAWYYPEPSEKAAEIKGCFAFWKGVEVQAS